MVAVARNHCKPLLVGVACYRHWKYFNVAIRIGLPQLLFHQHWERKPLGIVVGWLVGPNYRDPVAKGDGITKANDSKRSGLLSFDRVICAKVLRISGDHGEVPNYVVEIRLEPPQQERIAFKDPRLLGICDLHFLLRCYDEKVKTRKGRKRESCNDFNDSK